MPRPRKKRFCRRFRADRIFKPQGIPMTQIENISITNDQFEALLLCDREGYSQEEAGAKMGISRGTIQRLLYDGRKKILEAIYNNQALTINLNDKEDNDACMHTFHGRGPRR